MSFKLSKKPIGNKDDNKGIGVDGLGMPDNNIDDPYNIVGK